MGERRKFKRVAKRFTVRFGERELTFSGFTVDISLGGLFIISAQLPVLDSRLLVSVTVDGAKPPIFMVGNVQRHKVVPPELRSLAKNGFGLRLLRPDELVRLLVPTAATEEEFEGLEASFATASDFKSVWEREIHHGGIFVRTPRPFTVNQEVQLRLTLGFAQTSLEFPCRVVHLATGTDGNTGVGVLFIDPEAARQELGKFAV